MIRRRDVAIAALGGLAVTVVMNPVAALYLGRRIPGGLPDPLAEAWWISWAGHALLHQPGAFFQANASWPDPDDLARIDSLVGYAPFGALAQGWTGVMLVYDSLFLFATALAFGGAFLLARALDLPRGAAVVSGLAFACAPYRLAQNGHIYMLSSGGIPLALALLVSGYRRGNTKLVIGGWAVVAWQMSLSFSLGLQLVYLLAALGVGASVWLWRARRGVPPRPLRLATIAGVTAAAVVTFVIALPYLRVLYSQPHSPGTSVGDFSSQPGSFLIAPGQSFLYKYRMADARFALSAPDEQSLFPGLAILALAVTGLAVGSASRRLRWGLGLATLWLAYASLGIAFLHGWGGYAIVRHLPGWNGVRVPSRLMTLTTLALALLAGMGAQAVGRLLGRTGRPLRVLALGVIPVAIALEGFGPVQTWTPFHPAVKTSALAAPLLELPAAAPVDPLYEYWTATERFTPIVNGAGGTITPPWLLERYRAADSFPSKESVAYLRALGVRTVVLHSGMTYLTPWQGAQGRPWRGLGIRRRRVGLDYLYDLRG